MTETWPKYDLSILHDPLKNRRNGFTNSPRITCTRQLLLLGMQALRRYIEGHRQPLPLSG